MLPLGIIALVSQLGATRPEGFNPPGKDYWFAPERRLVAGFLLGLTLWVRRVKSAMRHP